MYLEIDEGYPTHRKTLRLCALLKCDTGDAYPPRLWAWAARSAPDGDLTGMDPTELELALRWRGPDGALFAALVSAGFVDHNPGAGTAVIHKWQERTGGAIEKMAVRAGMAKERRQHMDGKCLAACRYCAGTLTVRSPARSHQDKTRQDKTSPDKPSEGEAPALALVESVAECEPAAPPSELWAAADWLRHFAIAWAKRKGTQSYGQGGSDAVAKRELHEILNSLTRSERLDSQRNADAMFARYLDDPKAGTHPFKWFVDRFNGLRIAPKPKPGVTDTMAKVAKAIRAEQDRIREETLRAEAGGAHGSV